MVGELIIPAAALRDPSAKEMARVWIAEKGLHCSLHVGMYAGREDVDEQVAWGIILADMARHVANAFFDDGGSAPDKTLAAIRDAFLKEMKEPTSAVSGGFSEARPDLD